MLHRFNLLFEKIRSRLRLRGSRYAERLNRSEYSVYSQHGEDGIIAEIFKRIGTTDKYFVEFGAGEGTENNTACLAARGWHGTWLEGSLGNVEALRRNSHAGALMVKQAFITKENINQLLDEAGVPQEPDLLSIDIDGNDYWVWEAIIRKPRLVVAEYNPHQKPGWIMPYNPEHLWKKGSITYGATLQALEALGKKKGYVLVGCDSSGTNAFFVRQGMAQHFKGPHAPEELFEPARPYFRASRATL